MIRLVDTFLLDEFDWLIVLRRQYGEKALLDFSGQPNSDKNHFLSVVLDAPVLGHFLSSFVRVKSNVSPRPSTSTYPREMFDRTSPLKIHVLGMHISSFASQGKLNIIGKKKSAKSD